jgi:TonB-dependent receptor
MTLLAATASAQGGAGSIRGVVYDQDFEVPLAAARIQVIETGEQVESSDQGTYVFGQVAPGTYTLVFSKDGYVRQVKADVVVTAGRLTEVDGWLAGEFTEMEEFVVQDILALGAGTEAALLQLRLESPALMDSISADLMSRAGASDAASALRLVSGATVQDGKSAVIRGLPDRYVSSQMNGVRLPTADENKRAVELDQFPSTVIESIQVSKTFTPDQQGDASGGAVNIRTKGIPDEATFEVKGQLGYNSQVTGRDDFLTYDGGGVGLFGLDDGGRDPQLGSLGRSWDGASGVTEGDAPIDSKWSMSGGGSFELDNGVRIGGSATLFYERDSSFFDDGRNDQLWVENPGDPLTPQTNQGTAQDGEFKTSLFDVTQGKRSVQWGGLGTFGVESENHAVMLSYLYSHTAEDVATLATDTRGKEYFFPGYDPGDPFGVGNRPDNLFAAPYLRLETLEYTERTTQTLQLNGDHTLPVSGLEVGDALTFKEPQVDWVAAYSTAGLYQPDKRQFGALWVPRSYNEGVPPWIPPFFTEDTWFGYKPDANFNLGNFQRIWKEIDEESKLYALNLKLPFDQWSGNPGYFKTGLFRDQVDRVFDQDTFSNFGDSSVSYEGGWDDPWSSHFGDEDHPMTESLADVDYDGVQTISAAYAMVDLPLLDNLNLIGGARVEATEIGIVVDPEEEAVWFPPGSDAPVELNPGDADVDFDQNDLLPSVGLVYEPIDRVTVRASYSRTVARQTFKELTPVIQQEYLGAPIFIGNPNLGMSSLENWDARVDYRPYPGSLVSLSYFRKDIEDAIEYVQRIQPFTFTTAANYPEGHLQGAEVELRQDLGRFVEGLAGLSAGANATFIDSLVTLPDDEAAGFEDPGIQAPMRSREMTNAPEYLLNFYLTYDFAPTGTQVGLFYTIQGDTLVVGAGEANGNFVPSIYATPFDTLNLTLTQRLGEHFRLTVQAKNLTNPEIETVYRSPYVSGGDRTNTSYTAGVELSVALTARFSL